MQISCIFIPANIMIVVYLRFLINDRIGYDILSVNYF
jgi:hypothetical protein